MKTCTICKLPKSLTEFYKSLDGKLGVRARCKSCTGKIARKRIDVKYKTDPAWCESKRLQSSENNKKRSESGYFRQRYIDNKDEMLLRGKRWSNNNKEHHKILKSNWRKRNMDRFRSFILRRRARLRNAAGWFYTTPVLIKWRWEMFGNRCWMCGKEAIATDHVKPLTKGGSHWPVNLRPICSKCNGSKGAKIYSPMQIIELTFKRRNNNEVYK